MAFAVVQFTNEDGSFSEIPTSWLLEDGVHCYWPNHKNCGQLMIRNVLPGNDWTIEPIRIEGYYDTLEKARRIAQDPDYTSLDEQTRRRPKPNSKWLNLDASDEDSTESIDKPPQLIKNSRHKQQLTNNQSSANDKILEDATRQIMAIESVIGNYEVEGEFLTPITSTSKYIPPMNEELLNQEEEGHNYEQQDEHVIEQQDEHVIEQQEEDILTNLSVKIEKIYKCQLENNMYLKSIHKKLMKLELSENRPRKNTEAIKQYFPFEEVAQLVEFEEHLNPTTKKALIQYIEQIGGKSYKDNIHRCLRAMYSNSMAKSCSWLGQRGNVKMKDTTIINIIKDVVATSYTSTTSSDYESVVSEWFRLASSRMKAKKPLV